MKCNAIETNVLIIAYPSRNCYRNFAKFDNSCALLIAAGFYRPVLVILTELLKIIRPCGNRIFYYVENCTCVKYKDKPLRGAAAYVGLILLDQIGVHDLSIERGVHIRGLRFLAEWIKLVNHALGHLTDILLLPVDHSALQRQGELGDARCGHYVRRHSRQAHIPNFVGVPAGFGAAVAQNFPAIIRKRHIDRKLTGFLQKLFRITTVPHIDNENGPAPFNEPLPVK